MKGIYWNGRYHAFYGNYVISIIYIMIWFIVSFHETCLEAMVISWWLNTGPLHWSTWPFPTVSETCQVTGQNHRQRSLSTHLPFNNILWSPNKISIEGHFVEATPSSPWHWRIEPLPHPGVRCVRCVRCQWQHQIYGATSELSKISALSSIVPWGQSNIDVNSVNQVWTAKSNCKENTENKKRTK